MKKSLWRAPCLLILAASSICPTWLIAIDADSVRSTTAGRDSGTRESLKRLTGKSLVDPIGGMIRINDSGDSQAGLIRASVLPQSNLPILIRVSPSESPNSLGPSKSFTEYTANAIKALEHGIAAIGDPAATPTAYFQVSSLDDRSAIVTTFPSWRGLAGPGATFGAAFANEEGNRVQFGLHILGNGVQFRLINLQFHLQSSDPGHMLNFEGGFFPSDNYSPSRVGINYGPDGIKGTADDVRITTGPATQLVDELMYVGVADALSTQDLACAGADQAIVDCVKADYDSIIPFSATTTYTLFDDSLQMLASASGTVDFGTCVAITCPSDVVAPRAILRSP